jgi:RNA polymerase sigma-70 factor, ECF subfamily
MTDSSDWDWERYRKLLHFILRRTQLDPRLKRRFGSSDVVSETLLRAAKYKDQCRAVTPGQRVAWLKQILKNVVRDMREHERAEKRDVYRDQSIQDLAAASSVKLEDLLPADHSSPPEHVEREEELSRQAEAIDELPEDQQNVVILRFTYGQKIPDIALQLDKSEKSVSGLLHRGLRKLGDRLTGLREGRLASGLSA